MAKIMLIDDEIDLANLTAKRLKVWGFEVSLYHDGNGAMEKIVEFLPDLILLDIRLPHITGVEIFKAMSADDKLKNIPVVFFSASLGDERYCLDDLKAHGFVKKPYNAEQLLTTIKGLLAGRAGS